MCIPFGGNALTLAPTERGARLGKIMRNLMCFHAVLSVAYFVVYQWLNGIIDLILGLVGFFAVKNPDSFNVQQLLCVSVPSLCV